MTLRTLSPKSADQSNENDAVPVFAGDLKSAQTRFDDVVAVFLRCAVAEDLNQLSFHVSACLASEYGLTELASRIRQEIQDDRNALQRPRLRLLHKVPRDSSKKHGD